MQRSLRHKLIIQSVQRSGEMRVDQLVELTGASPITVRRDLAELAALGALRRTRGGAARTAKFGHDVPYAMRAAEGLDAKVRSATAAAALVRDDDAVIIDNGTTCHAAARELAGRPITALALSLHTAAALAAVPGARVIVPGGPVEADSLQLLGHEAFDAVRSVQADIVLLGTCSVSPGRGLTAGRHDDAQLKRLCLGAATTRVLLATGAKLELGSTFRFGDPGDLTHLITTKDAPGEIVELVADAGVHVELV